MKTNKKALILRGGALLLVVCLSLTLTGCAIGTNRIGYIDKEGNQFIPGVYVMVEPFHEGMAAVMLGEEGNAYWGFINTEQRTAIGLNYANARPFYDGCAPVQKRDSNETMWVYIDKDGHELFNGASFEDASVFIDGYAPVADRTTKKYGYIDRTGELAHLCTYDLASIFSETDHVAMIRIGGESMGLCGYIDLNFETVIEPQYYYASTFQNGYATVKLSADADASDWGFIDLTGKIVLGGDYAGCGEFSEGMAPVAIQKDGKPLWGFINTDGEWVIEPQYANALSFSEGLAGVQLNEGKKNCGYINTSNEFVIEPIYTDMSDFSEGYAAVQGGNLETY